MTNSIQISHAKVDSNGGVIIKMPSVENRDKLSPILQESGFSSNRIEALESKSPTIAVLDVENYTTKEEFVEKVKNQNPDIREKIETGSLFKVVFGKKRRDNDEIGSAEGKYYQVIIRVSEDIREIIRHAGNRIFMELSSFRVIDRFYIKRCNKCQTFGHYQKDCKNGTICGFCCADDHLSPHCPKKTDDKTEYNCINCKNAKKEYKGHSTHWIKCPTYVELQEKLKKSIPYYSTKNNL